MTHKITIEIVLEALVEVEDDPSCVLNVFEIMRRIGLGDVGQFFKVWLDYPEFFDDVVLPQINEYDKCYSHFIEQIHDMVGTESND